MLPPVEYAPPIERRLLLLAERHPRRALALARRLVVKHHTDPWALFTLGWALFRFDQAPEAAPLFAHAWELFASQGQPLLALHARRALLLARITFRASAIEQHEWDALAAAFNVFGQPLEVARVRVQQAGFHNIHGAPEAARTLLAPLIPLLTAAGTNDDRARMHLVLGSAHSDLGQFAAALDHFAQAIAAFSAARSNLGLARCQLERSNVYLRQEVFAPALDDLHAARSRFYSLGLTLRAAQCDKAIGLVESRMGRYDKALAALLRARRVFVNAQARLELAHTDLNLGVVAAYCGMHELAHVAYTRARRVYHDLGVQRMQLVCERNLASVQRTLGRLREALHTTDALLATLESGGDALEHAETMLLGALIRLEMGQRTAARGMLEQAASAFATLNNQAAVAECQLEQGWMLLAEPDLAVAEAVFRQAQEPLALRPFHAWRVAYGLGTIAEARGEMDQARGYFALATAHVARLRGSLASEDASSRVFVQAAALIRDAIRLAAHADDAADVLRLAEQQRALALAAQLASPGVPTPDDLTATFDVMEDTNDDMAAEQDRLVRLAEQVLYRRNAVERFVSEPGEFDLSLLREQLDAAYPGGWHALSYLVTERDILIVSLDQATLALTTVPLDPALSTALKQATLPRFRHFTYLDFAWQQGQTDRPWAALALLGERLIPPDVRARLRPEQPLLIVPAGALHAIPWPALRVDEGWLCERAVVLQLPALRLWPLLAERQPRSAAALLLGCQTFADNAAPLPAISAELNAIEQRWSGSVHRHERDQATRTWVYEKLAHEGTPAYGLIHVASHAVWYPHTSMLAHIKLADGPLLLDEIYRLSLNGAMVVLSACEGGAHDVLPGEELLGLGRALLAAGASVVVASLWKVYDQAMLEVLMPFYEALGDGADVPVALAHAQRTVIARASSDGGVDASAPLVWGSLYVLGIGRRAAGPTSGTTPASVQDSNKV